MTRPRISWWSIARANCTQLSARIALLFPYAQRRLVTDRVQSQVVRETTSARAERKSCECKIKGRGTRGWITACLHMVWCGTEPDWARAAMLRGMASLRAFPRAVPD
jgi:hypothetical protein